MRPLSKLQSTIFVCGAVLMAAGAGLSLLDSSLAPFLFAAGAVGFASMQMMQRYEGTNPTLKRLRRILTFSDVLFLFAALLMFAGKGNPLHLDQITFLQYVYQKWVVVVLLAAILQLYAVHRIDHELGR